MIPNEMLLDRKKRNDLFETVELCNADPADFEVSWQDRQVELKHTRSRARFEARSMDILSRDADWAVEWVAGQPEEEITKKEYVEDFDEVLEQIPRWLKAIEADEAVPDRWAELEQQRRAFSARALGEGDNTPFTPDEQRQITGALKELMAHAQETYELSDRQTHELRTRIDYLADAVKRFGRHDWRNLVVGTLASAVAGAYLPPEAVRGVVGTLASSIGHVFGTPLPQLPA